MADISDINFKLNSSVLGLSMLSFSPGIASIGRPGPSEPAEVVRATIETIFVGTAAVLITRSWIPLISPFAYLMFQYVWARSGIKQTINENVPTYSDAETLAY